MESAIDDNTTTLRVASFACYLDTAKDSLVHRVSAQEAPIKLNPGTKAKTPVARQASGSSAAAAASFLKGSSNDGGLRVDSFSYLNAGGQNFMFNVPKPIQDSSKFTFFSKELPKDGGEISVFGADRYFNAIKLDSREGRMIRHNVNHPMQQQMPAAANLARVGSDPRIIRSSSLCSETTMSSWNSRALIPNLPRNEPKRSTPSRRSCWFPGFACKGGPCFDRKDVCVNEERLVQNETVADRRIESPANQNQGTENPIPNMLDHRFVNLEESRNSIEVFGSGIAVKGDIAANMERKLSMLTWDAIPKPTHSFPAAPATLRSSTVCDDMASDASSDLFEIENISGSMYPGLAEAADGAVSGCTSPVSCYAPSEASIQWSVVTASAADYSSVLSECCNDEGISREIGQKTGSKVARPEAKGRAGGLLGCASQKAVDVAEHGRPCKANEKTTVARV